MNIAIIDPSPLSSNGLSLLLTKKLHPSSIKAFNDFEEFVISISNNLIPKFNLVILNSIGYDSDHIIGYLRILNSFIEEGHIVLIYDNTSPLHLQISINQNKIHHFSVDNDMKKFESFIKSIIKK